MNKKIFQIIFFVFVLLAFGFVIKNYVNSIKSDIKDYTGILDEVPQRKISRLSPIIIRLAQDIDNQLFSIDKPLQNDIIQFTPSINGYIYFTDKRTIEFQPNEPLPTGTAYSCKLNVKNIFPATKLKPFRFEFSTPASTFKIKINEIVYYDSTKISVPYIKGHITFNDYVNFEKKQKLVNARQNKQKLFITYMPGNDIHSVNFLINGIKRTKYNNKVIVIWNGQQINSKIKDSTAINIASADSFKVVYCKLKHFPKPILKIRFTDAISNKMVLDSLINILQLKNYNITYRQNEITIKFKNITNKTHKLHISKALLNNKDVALNKNFNFVFKLTHPYPIITLSDSSHYITQGKSPNLIDVNILNIKRIKVKITHVPNNNMMQFLQVNNLTGKNELERVGKNIFIKTYNLQTLLNYNPNELTTYNLNLLGADLSKSGLYNFEFSYNANDVVHKISDTTIIADNALAGNKINENIIVYSHNIIFSDVNVIAKRTPLDTLYIMVSNYNTGMPAKNAKIEIFDYQQNKLATLTTNKNGITKAKIINQDVFIRVIHKSQITYLKLSSNNSIAQNSNVNNGIKLNRGLLCHINGLKPAYLPTDSMQIGVILKKNGLPNLNKKNLEIMLESPGHFFFNTRIVPALSTSLTLYKVDLPFNCKNGNWNIVIKYGQAEFKYPFKIIKKNILILPVQLNINKENNTASIISNSKTVSLKNQIINTEIIPIKRPIQSNIAQSKFNLFNEDSTVKRKIYKTRFNKYGKAKIELPNWTKTGIQFRLTVSVHLTDNIVLQKDTILAFNGNNNGLSKIINLQTNTAFAVETITNYDTIVKTLKSIITNKGKIPTINITTNKTNYNIGDSCIVFYKSKKPVNAMATIENGTHILSCQWVQCTPSLQKTGFIITKQMLPGFYISFLPYNSLKNIPCLKYINVLGTFNNNEIPLKADIPHDWTPGGKIPLHIANTNNNSLKYYVYISPKIKNHTKKSSISSYFNQKQLNSISTWSSVYLQNRKLDTDLIYNTNIIQKTNFTEPCIKPNSVNKPQLLLGPFYLSANKRVTHYIKAPTTQNIINIKIVGIENKTGRVFEVNKTAEIYEPISIEAKTPTYINAGDIVELPINIYNNTLDADTLLIQIKNTHNIELYCCIEKNVIVDKKSLKSFTLKFRTNKVVGNGQFQILTKSDKAHTTKTINIPIQSNPNYLTHSVSTIIPMQKQWQQTITPIGIKGTNTARLELSSFNIPNIWLIIQSLNKNTSNNLAYLINKSFPLIYLNNIINNDVLKHRFTKTINSTLLQLIKYQTKQGGFKNTLSNTEPTGLITSYAGEFMLKAKQNGYKINEGVLNRWKRYQQRELQKLKFLPVTENSNQTYVVYTLTLANLVEQKQLYKCILYEPSNTVNRLYMAKAFIASGNKKYAKLLIKNDSIKTPINELTISESALMLSLANDLGLNNLTHQLIKQINKQINSKGHTPYEIAMALNSILKTMSLSNTDKNTQLIYQINNGKDLPHKSNTLLSYIAIPLNFTLAKHIDIKNTGTDTLHLNLVYTGSPQKISSSYSKPNKLHIANRYHHLDNNLVKTLNFSTEEYYKQVVTYKNLDKQLKQNLSVSIPIPCGVELVYSNAKMLNIENSPISNNTIQTKILLKPYETKKVVMVFKTKFKGQYISYPIKTFNNKLFYSETYTPQLNISIH